MLNFQPDCFRPLVEGQETWRDAAEFQCPLLGAKRTLRGRASMSVSDQSGHCLRWAHVGEFDQIGPADCQGCELGQGIRPSASNAERTAARLPMRSRYER